MVRKSILMALFSLSIVMHAPAQATHEEYGGVILVGNEVLSKDCSREVYKNDGGRYRVGLNAVCFDKPSGVINWYLEYDPTRPVDCIVPATMDIGSNKVMVYGGPGVINQTFILKWVHSAETVIPPPPC